MQYLQAVRAWVCVCVRANLSLQSHADPGYVTSVVRVRGRATVETVVLPSSSPRGDWHRKSLTFSQLIDLTIIKTDNSPVL